jgi:hypothetical protein
MNRSFVLSIVICLVLNLVVSFLVRLFIPNYYLSSIIISIVLSFIFSIISIHGQTQDGLHFFKYPSFWMTFFVTAIIFLLMNFIMFMIMR